MPASRSEQQAVLGRFLVALRTGELQQLMDVLAPDVVLIADGGGVAAAVLAPIRGADQVAALLVRASQATVETVWLNGAPAGLIDMDGDRTAISLAVEHGRVTRVYLIRNPRKLTRLDAPAVLVR
jgi:RNA polymerase sigma-70 factor (ECF subfamily)